MGLTNLQIPAWDVIGLGIPPTYGKIRFLVANKLTDKYAAKLNEYGFPDSDVYTTLATAYAAMDDSQGDTLVVFPGAYTPTAELTWSLNDARLIGFGSPNQRHTPAAGITGMVRFYCSTAAVGSILKVTGYYNQFSGFETRNTANNANNLADIKILGKNNYFKNCAFRSGGGASQVNTDAGYAIWFDTSVAGYGNCTTFEMCAIGDPFGTARTGGGVIYASGTAGQAANVEFKDCRIMMTCETASTAICAIKLAGNYAIDRYMLLQDTVVYNFSTNLANLPTQAITDSCGTTHMILLGGSTQQYGFGKWCNSGTYVFSALPQANAAGGKATTITS